MILSMTGFGQAQLEEEGHAYHLELRSVNNRYFKLSLRIPEDLDFLQAEIEQLLRARLTRGSFSLRLDVRDLSAAAASDINIAAVQHYLSQLGGVAASHAGFMIDLATIAALPGVCQPRELSDAQRHHAHQVTMRLLEGAIDGLMTMRAAEGRALAEDLLRHCAHVRANLEEIRIRTPRVVAEYRDRLMARIHELVAGSNVHLAQEHLLREIAIYAERSDISEEISRLGSHLDQFQTTVAGPEPAGRKLDFISQEMFREANTIGAKAGDAEIARHTIEIKGAIDRIKEQVQNVE